MSTYEIAGIFLVGLTLLAGHAEAQEPAPGKQVEQKIQLPGGKEVGFLLYLPEDYEPGRGSWPLMLFLHGRGESDGPLSLVAKWGPPKLVERGEHLPYVLVSPQCPREEFWSQDGQQEVLVGLLDYILDKYDVDPERTVLTGLSMGGFGSWRLAADHPDRFAAVAPICGAGAPENGEKLTSVPIWAWHGQDDPVVPVERSIEMVEAIRAAGGESVRLTTLEGVGHNSWSPAYATPDLYQWFERQFPERDK